MPVGVHWSNPGAGPTRCLIPLDSLKPPKDREETLAKIEHKMKKHQRKSMLLSAEAKKKGVDAYSLRCRVNKAYVEELKERGRRSTKSSPYAVDQLKQRLEMEEEKDAILQRQSYVLKVKQTLRSMTGKPKHTLCTPDICPPYERKIFRPEIGEFAKFRETRPEYKLALEHNITVENLIATSQEERAIRKMIAKELSYLEKEFPIVAVMHAMKLDANMPRSSASLIGEGGRSHSQIVSIRQETSVSTLEPGALTTVADNEQGSVATSYKLGSLLDSS